MCDCDKITPRVGTTLLYIRKQFAIANLCYANGRDLSQSKNFFLRRKTQ